jgi:hypothetical protein
MTRTNKPYSMWKNDKTIPCNCIKCHKRLSITAQTLKRHMKRCLNVPYNKIHTNANCVRIRIGASK